MKVNKDIMELIKSIQTDINLIVGGVEDAEDTSMLESKKAELSKIAKAIGDMANDVIFR